ncbi:MAG: chorismate synthase [Kiritimatiellae bacterium]|nr:chorismate synthase [Kiritimatiellia bacterium]
MGSTIGNNFVVTTFGESHGLNVGAVIDGCPAMLELNEDDIQPQLDRRRPGQSALSTPRDEKDQVRIVSGVENGLTLGTPICMLVDNKDQRPGDYKEMSNVPRPSHADFTYKEKYGVMAASGGGRASARETIGRVVAGAVAEKVLAALHGISITAWVSSEQDIIMPDIDLLDISRNLVDKTVVRCPDVDTAQLMEARIASVLDDGDSVGGVVTCVCQGVPTGWGEPIFDKLEASLAKAMLSIPAAKGFEIGSGFAGTLLRGSEHNDMYVMKKYGLGTVTNNSGGIQGGISNGEPIIFRVAFKPVATISLPQDTVDYDGKPVVFEAKGRHDPCVLPRAVPIVESMAALVLADLC